MKVADEQSIGTEREGLQCVAQELCMKGILSEAGRTKLELFMDEGRLEQVSLFLLNSIREATAAGSLPDMESVRLSKTVRASQYLVVSGPAPCRRR